MVMEKFLPVVIALVFHLIDMGSGLCVGIKQKDLQSSKMRDGMFKKCGYILCYMIAWLLDNYGEYAGISLSFHILPIIITYAVGVEIVSIFENIYQLNDKLLPEKLMELFHIKKGDS